MELSLDQLPVEIEPGTPLMPQAQLRRAASFAPADLVTRIVIGVAELSPAVARFLLAFAAGIADPDDLASAPG